MGTGAVSLNGASTIAVDKDFAVGANGSTGTSAIYTAFAQSGAGTFSTGTGAVTLNTDVAIASGKDLQMTCAVTFASGIGAVTLNGDVAIASGKDLHMTGAGILDWFSICPRSLIVRLVSSGKVCAPQLGNLLQTN